MRITDIHVDGFGVWNELSVDDMNEGVTLFFGRNEAGKTTLMQFVRATLYGFSPQRRKLYLPPVHGGEPGGMLRVENHSGQFVIERRLSDRNEHSLGSVVVLAANGSRQGQHLLNVLVSGVDESIFQNVFAIGIRELQELATLNNTQASELLYNLASGVDRVSLVDVMRVLEADRHRILPADNESGEIDRLLEQQTRLVTEVSELQSETRFWTDLAAERSALVDELEQLSERIHELEHGSRTLEIAIRVRDKWYQRADCERQRDECGQVEALPEGSLQRLEEIEERIAQQQEVLAAPKKKRMEVRRELAAQPINRALWDLSCRIEAMCEHGPWIDSLGSEIKRLREEIEESELKLLRHDEKLVVEGGVTLSDAPVVTPRTVQQLQPAALALREAMKKRVIARKQQKQSRQEESHAADELQNELAGRNVEDLDDAMETTGQLVKQLRRRGKLKERLDQMERQEEELQQEHHDLLDSQVQRIRILVGIGVMFVFGFVLVLTGIFGWRMMPMPAELSWGLSFLGLICVGMSVAWKIVVERTSQEELNTCSRRRESLEREIEQAIEDRAELDRLLPHGSNDFSARLETAERELKELEGMAPIHQERIEARRRIQEAKRNTSTVVQDALEARKRWRRALRQCGLPETLTAKHVRQLGAHHQKKSKIEEQLGRQRARFEKLAADRDALVERLQTLYEEVGIGNVSQDPQIQLSQLAAALSGQREMAQQRRALQQEEKEMRRELAGGLRTLRRLQRGREALFAEARVTDENELRHRIELLDRIASLEQRREHVTEQISGVIGEHCDDEDIASVLDAHSPDHLQADWENLVARLRDCQAHKGQLHQRRGEINQEMKSLAENQRLSTAKFELECARTKLANAQQRWRVSSVTGQLLESIREAYEAERQPETLEEASLYLERLTEGKYSRVWTPLGRNELRVDDEAGHALPLEVLSRGTREAVFLSLRFALVASYGRRGVNIPLVLDDVLVNLDAQRAAAAVRALCDFAQEGRQLLFFTCHEHIRKMFEAARVDIRVLPGHGTPGVRVKPMEFIEAEDEEEEVPAVAEEELVEEVEIEEECEEETVEGPVAEEEYLEEDVEEEDYSLQAAIERTANQLAIDLSQFETEEEKPPQPEVVQDVDAIQEPEAGEVEEEVASEGEEEAELVEQVDQLFGALPDEDDSIEGPWWDPERRHRLKEEEAAA
ncbi:MAG: AAA family ATPase [Pirellulaceae bacterium]